MTPVGTACIYNWKNGPAWNRDGSDWRDIRVWHVGALKEEVIPYVQEYIDTH